MRKFSQKNRKLYEAWDTQDPVDVWECIRSKRIVNIQGNENSFVKEACVVDGLW
ncbi:MAG: endonuclease [Desulfobacteraceae bacterium]|jgi:deoxyribonuclease-1|nr:MAG: endonuclease [Desulfobacteraceae bacterium]